MFVLPVWGPKTDIYGFRIDFLVHSSPFGWAFQVTYKKQRIRAKGRICTKQSLFGAIARTIAKVNSWNHVWIFHFPGLMTGDEREIGSCSGRN
jgi:hypothetical protein